MLAGDYAMGGHRRRQGRCLQRDYGGPHFPSLADVLTDSLTAEDFGPLDLSLGNMAGTGSDGRGLDESDFLNPSALSDPEDSSIYELSQPSDLWSTSLCGQSPSPS